MILEITEAEFIERFRPEMTHDGRYRAYSFYTDQKEEWVRLIGAFEQRRVWTHITLRNGTRFLQSGDCGHISTNNFMVITELPLFHGELFRATAANGSAVSPGAPVAAPVWP